MLPVNGLYGHIQRNNLKSLLLLGVFLLLFEMLAFVITLTGIARDESILRQVAAERQAEQAKSQGPNNAEQSKATVVVRAELSTFAFIKKNFVKEMGGGAWLTPLTGAFCWLFVAWLFLNRAVAKATHAVPAKRRDEPRLYNLVENLSILAGLPRPAIYVMETDALNAYAAGLMPATAMIAVSRGLLDCLDDRELEAVLAHEITHIKNRDTRLVAVAGLFSGIVFRFAWVIISVNLKPNPMMVLMLPFLPFFFWQILGIVLWACAVVIFGGWLTRFAISRARDYAADAGAVELTKNPDALASALQKVDGKEALNESDIAIDAMLFATSTSGMLSTNPSPRERVRALRAMLPGLVAEKSMRGLSHPDEQVTWEAIKAAARRAPKWVSHPYVLVPALLMNFGVTYAIASVWRPELARDMESIFSPPPLNASTTSKASAFPFKGASPQVRRMYSSGLKAGG